MATDTKGRARSAELADMYSEPRHVTVRMNVAEDRAGVPEWKTEQVRVDELQVWQYGPLMKILHELGAVIESTDNIIALLANHSSEAFRIVALATGWSEDSVSRLAASDFVNVAYSVYEVNRDFFIRNLGNRVDAVTAMVSRMVQQTTTALNPNGDGSTLSPSFASTAELPTPNGSH